MKSLLLLLAGLLTPLPAFAAEKPNILLIVVDDMGWGDLGVNWQNARAARAAKAHRTPNLDAMAAAGVNVRRHYCAAPVCAPSRATLLTGVHQGNAVIRDNRFDAALEDNHTIGSVLSAAGYHTALIGKYGLQGGGFDRDPTEGSIEGFSADWDAYPTRRGFDQFFGTVRHVDGHQHYPADRWAIGNNAMHRSPKQLWCNDVQITDRAAGSYTTDLYTAYAKQTIVDSARGDTPFFVLLTYDTPHAALQLPPAPYPDSSGAEGGAEWTGGEIPNVAPELDSPLINLRGPVDSYRHPDYVDRGWTDVQERFATSVRRIDDAIGDLLATLDDLDIADETLVVFTSDNGPHRESYIGGADYDPTSFASYGPFDGIKRDCWEGGIRMPTIVRWPGRIAPAADETLSQSQDWMATFAEIAGVPAPARCDGVSLLPRWDDRQIQSDSDIYIEYFNPDQTPPYDDFADDRRGSRRGQMQVVFVDGYKGVRYDIRDGNEPFEIYDVQSDPGERSNLAGGSTKFDNIQTRMQRSARQHHSVNVDAPRPYDDTPIPAADAPIAIKRSLLPGHFGAVPKFDPTLVTGATEVRGLNFVGVPDDYTGAVHFTGTIEIPRTIPVTFTLENPAPSFLRVAGQHVIDHDRSQQTTATIPLAAGHHQIQWTVLLNKSTHPRPTIAVRAAP